MYYISYGISWTTAVYAEIFIEKTSISSHVVKHWQFNHISTTTAIQNEQFTLSRSVQVGWYSCLYHVSVGLSSKLLLPHLEIKVYSYAFFSWKQRIWSIRKKNLLNGGMETKQAVKNGLRSAGLMFCNFLCAHKVAMCKADHASNLCSQTNSLKAFAVREN